MKCVFFILILLTIILAGCRQNSTSNKILFNWEFPPSAKYHLDFKKLVVAEWHECCKIPGDITETLELKVGIDLLARENDVLAEFSSVSVSIKNESGWQKSWNSDSDKEIYDISEKISEGSTELSDLVLYTYSSLHKKSIRFKLEPSGKITFLDNPSNLIPLPAELNLWEDKPNPIKEIAEKEIQEIFSTVIFEIDKEQTLPIWSYAHWRSGSLKEVRRTTLAKTSSNGRKKILKVVSSSGKGRMQIILESGEIQQIESSLENHIVTGEGLDKISAKIKRNVFFGKEVR